jgi:hypothetical protein
MARHADRAGAILREAGYDDDTVARVRSLIKKQRMATDPEAQTLEDVACMVFLVLDFEEFAGKHDDDKVIDIVQKTWKKMSEPAHQAALGLELPPRLGSLVKRALS